MDYAQRECWIIEDQLCLSQYQHKTTFDLVLTIRDNLENPKYELTGIESNLDLGKSFAEWHR